MADKLTFKAQFARLTLGLMVGLMVAMLYFSAVADGWKKQAALASPTRAENSTGEELRTPQDHLGLAENHRQKAARFRHEAEEAKKSMEKEARAFANCPKCGPNLQLNRMTAKYKSFVREAEAQADEQGRLAQYHLLMAKEMQEHR